MHGNRNNIIKAKNKTIQQFNLAPGANTVLTRNERRTYIVRMSVDGYEGKYEIVLNETNQKELVITYLTRGREVYFTVAVMNSVGEGCQSEPVPFLPR